MAFIKDRRLAQDHWKLLDRVEPGDDGVLRQMPAGDLIVPLATWKNARDQLVARGGRLGVWLSADEEPADIAGDLQHLDVVAVRFASFTDGRGYSIGRLLRQRYGWRGELRAIGDVQRDQIFYLARCGFDAFLLREGEDPAIALTAFSDFSDGYQASAERPVPLFRRREPVSSGT
ncbi:MAG TPA: DUF934 domain-containing protein [Burkholderiales bacterium]|nr:DUF934 domain-containing protein [Burkholderiales bacterium]